MDESRKQQTGWPALWALVPGFCMALADSTVVAVATPAIMRAFSTDVASVVWVTSAFLLAFAVPALITGRLGERFGPKSIYIVGLAIFTFASLLCGLADSLAALVALRLIQGLGAALMTPQTLAVIMRALPTEQRGHALRAWGGIAGFALLIGPLLGGLLVDAAGWEWIFFVNVPIGVLGLLLTVRFVPVLPRREMTFDTVGILLSAAAVTCIIFGLQEGAANQWGLYTVDLGSVHVSVAVVGLIAVGIALFLAFLWWQSVTLRDPLVPLALFRDRGLARASIATAAVGFAVTSMAIPLFLYAQTVGSLSATQAALLLVPMAAASALLSPMLGPYLQRRDPRRAIATGMLGMALAIVWLAAWIWFRVDIWLLLLPSALVGVSSALVWGPLATVALRDVDPRRASVAGGLYNSARYIGCVMGSAGIASIITARLRAEVPLSVLEQSGASLGNIQPFASSGLAVALGQAMLAPAIALGLGLIAVMLLPAPRLKTAILQTQDLRPE